MLRTPRMNWRSDELLIVVVSELPIFDHFKLPKFHSNVVAVARTVTDACLGLNSLLNGGLMASTVV
eukprot:scaffold92887_cov29-Prasinocladus_malaysianus.AAC.1